MCKKKTLDGKLSEDKVFGDFFMGQPHMKCSSVLLGEEIQNFCTKTRPTQPQFLYCHLMFAPALLESSSKWKVL